VANTSNFTVTPTLRSQDIGIFLSVLWKSVLYLVYNLLSLQKKGEFHKTNIYEEKLLHQNESHGLRQKDQSSNTGVLISA
jgi:hypothetical protein